MPATLLVAMFVSLSIPSCTPTEPNALDKLGTVDLNLKDLDVRAWIADDSDEQAKGLMFVTAEEIAPLDDGTERGMLFVFPRDQRTGFWMRNTIIDLDIAFIAEDGRIVQTFTMTALDENSYTPRSAYRYALELRAGTLEREGITEDDQIDIPETVLKRTR